MSLLLDTLRKSAKEKADSENDAEEFFIDDETLEELDSTDEEKEESTDEPLAILDEDKNTGDGEKASGEQAENSEPAPQSETPKPDTPASAEIKPTQNQNDEKAPEHTPPENTQAVFSAAPKKKADSKRFALHRYAVLALILIPLLIVLLIFVYWSTMKNTPAIEENFSPEAEMAVAQPEPQKNILRKSDLKSSSLKQKSQATDKQNIINTEKTRPSSESEPVISEKVSENKVSEKKASTDTTPRSQVKPPASPAPAKITIKKHKKPSPLSTRLNEAYSALVSGEITTAETLYQGIVAQHPNHIHALLALAKISSDKRDTKQANFLYERVLRIDNSNATAQLGLLHSNPQAENTIEALAQRFPQNANIAAAKGAFYAEEGNWHKAQKAYFDAFSLQPNNAAFAFNLAVALDQLKKYKTAKEFYRASIELARKEQAKGAQVAIDVATIQARIAQLELARDQ